MMRAGGRAGPGNPGLAAKLEAERRMKEGISGHKTGLPKKLLELFGPTGPVVYLDPIKKKPPALPYTGIGQYVDAFAAPGDPEYEPHMERPPSPRLFRNPEMPAQARVEKETKTEKRLRIIKEKTEAAEQQIEEGLQSWNPAKDPDIEGDPFKTLFVARISYEATEKQLQREFEEFGPIKRIRMVQQKDTGKPRGYAFIEFEHKNDMKQAYKLGDGKKIEGRRTLVDVERGRTVPNWRPRRLGGGRGGESRVAREPKNINRRLAKGLPAVALPGAPQPPALAPTPSIDRARPARDDGAERDREAERERERARAARAETDRVEKERGDRERLDRERDERRERDARGPDRGRSRDKDRERDKDRDKDKDREREREREKRSDREKDRHRERDREKERGAEREKDRGSDRKRERDARDGRERDDGRSSKRLREEDGSRRRERERDA